MTRAFLESLFAGFLRQLPRLIVAAIAFLFLLENLERLDPPGWDEATHVGLPAAELSDHLAAGRLASYAHAALGLAQYPPGYPAWLSLSFLLTGASFAAARGLTALCFALLSVLSAALADHLVGSRQPTRAGWVTQGFVLSSPLFVHFGRTLFLEVPFTLLAVFAVLLHVKLERRELEGLPPGPPERLAVYLLPGLALAAASFVKWNYGVLIVAVFLLDRVVAGWARRRDRRRSVLASVYLFAPTVVLASWWFVLPWPAEMLAVGAHHRHVFWAYLTDPRPRGISWHALGLYLGWFAHLSIAVAGACGLFLLASFRWLRNPGHRIAAMAVFLFLGTTAWHEFKLGRFLIPGLAFTWVLAGSGYHALTERLSLPTRAWVTFLGGFLLLLSASPWALTPARCGYENLTERTLVEWRDPYASPWVPVPAPKGLSELTELIVEHTDPQAPKLLVLRTSHELPPASLAWAIGNRLHARGVAGYRWFLRSSVIHDLDVSLFAQLPAGWSDRETARRELEAAIARVDMVCLLDPGYALGRAFRGEVAAEGAYVQELAREILEESSFQIARRSLELGGAEARYEIGFSYRTPRVTVTIYVRRGQP